MKEKLRYESSSVVFADENSREITAIARKREIKVPSTHLGFFKTVYARIEDANRNGIRLAREAVDKSLKGLIGSQVNFEHFRAGFVCGNILDAWVNANDEIVVVYSFFKSIYPDEYEQSLELMEEGKLSVSFELLADRESKEILSDGTIRLHDIDFQGMGHLMEAPPAEPTAKVFEFAKRVKERLHSLDQKELLCASEIEKACDNVLSEHDRPDEPLDPIIYMVTSMDDNHFHLAKVNIDGNGETINTMGRDRDFHIHRIVNWQFQESDGHAHRTRDEIWAQIKKDVQKIKEDNSQKVKSEKMEESTLTEEQIKQVEKVRAELGDIAKDVSDKDLLDEAKVSELREAKEEQEKKAESKNEETKDEEAKEESKEDSEEAEEEVSELEKAQNRIAELEEEVEKLKSTLESKDSEIDSVKENAEKIASLKIELKDNPYAKDFSDEDYLDEAKVEKAKLQKERDDLKSEVESLKSKEDSEEKEDSKEAEKESKDSEEASEDKEEDMETGSEKDEESESFSGKVIQDFFKGNEAKEEK